MNKDEIIIHKNYEFLKNLNESINNFDIFLINYSIDEMISPELFITVEEALVDILNIHWSSIYRLLGSKDFEIILFGGKLFSFKEQVNYGILEERLEEKLESMEYNYSFISEPKEKYIEADFHFKTRCYFISVQKTMSILNISYTALNKLINDKILKVIIRRTDIYFYSYEVMEILKILREGEDHWLDIKYGSYD